MGEPDVQEGRCGGLEWAVLATPFPGQRRSGDGFLVEETVTGTLVALVDALGHGDDAADVADHALYSLHQTAGQPLPDCVAACHAALRGSRGAAVTLAMVETDFRRVTWAGVGNVEAAVVRRSRRGAPVFRRSVILRAGVIGDRLPHLRPSTEPISDGDTLIAATDGLRMDFLNGVDPWLPPAKLARRLHRLHAKGTDDALVLASRFLRPTTEVRSGVAPYF